MVDRLISILVVMLALLGYSSKVKAQNFSLIHYSVENKLPSNNIYNVYRDSKGFLWFSSDKGLVRYNGISFETFTTFDKLVDNEIFFVQEDAYGRIWMASYNGELSFYKDGILYTEENTPFLKLPFKAAHIDAVTPELDSSITITFSRYRKFINIKKNSCNVYDISKFSKGKEIEKNEGMHILKISDHTFKLVYPDKIIEGTQDHPIETKLPSNNILSLRNCQDWKYLLNDTGIYSLSGVLIFKFVRPRTQKIVFRTAYNDGKNIFTAYSDGLFLNDSIPIIRGIYVTGITQDIAGNYWITTKGKGIYKLNRNFDAVREYKNVYNGNIQFAQTYNSYLFYTTRNQLFRFRNGENKCLFTYPGRKPDNVDEIACFIEDGIYYSCETFKFYVLKKIAGNPIIKQYKISKRYALKNISLTDTAIYVHERNAISYFTFDELDQRGQIKPHEVINKQARIFDMGLDERKMIWYNTIDNVYKLSSNKSIPQPQFNGIAFKWFEILGDHLVGCTHHNQLLVCSDFHGKLLIDTVKGNNCVWDKSYRMSNKRLFISTNNYYRILTINTDTSKARFSVQTVENKFVPMHADYVCADSAHCYFFKNGSVFSIDIQELFRVPTPPSLFLTSITTKKATYFISQGANTHLNIPFNESGNITIKFTALAFNNDEVVYEYCFHRNGESEHWEQVKNEEIHILAPDHGKYSLKIRSKSLSGIYSTPVMARISISSPFWATWPFAALCVLALLAILFIIQRYTLKTRIRKKEKKHNAEIRFLKSEYKALNALMNPHFIFNSLNNIQSLVNEGDKLSANQYLKYFSELVRQNMHNISQDLIPLQKEITLVTNYLKLEKLRFNSELNYTIKIDEDTETDLIMIPPLLIQPLVENAIKHGLFIRRSQNNHISIRIKEIDGFTSVEIEDNGVGLNYKKQQGENHQSFGLENIKKRIDQIRLINKQDIIFRLEEVLDDTSQVCGTLAVLLIRTNY